MTNTVRVVWDLRNKNVTVFSMPPTAKGRGLSPLQTPESANTFAPVAFFRRVLQKITVGVAQLGNDSMRRGVLTLEHESTQDPHPFTKALGSPNQAKVTRPQYRPYHHNITLCCKFLVL